MTSLSTQYTSELGFASCTYFLPMTFFFFTRAIARDCKNLSRLLLDFYESSDQLMSATKSKTWFSPCTPRHIKEQVAGILGLPTTDRIGTYIGTPIFTTS